jgi:uncharacterized protein (TIGR03067 family)
MSESNKGMSGPEVMNALQGEWKHVYCEFEGQMPPPDEFSTTVMQMEGNKFVVKKGGKVVDEGKFSVNVDITPNEIVLIYSKGPEMFLGAPRNVYSKLYVTPAR